MAKRPDGSYEYGVFDSENLLGRQILQDEGKRGNQKFGPPPSQPEQPFIYAPLKDESSFMQMPAGSASGTINSAKPASVKPKLAKGQIVAVGGCAFIALVLVSASGGNSIAALLTLLGMIYITYKIMKSQLRNSPKVSTGAEMDAILIAKYNRDVARYKKKLQSRRWEQSVAQAAGVRNVVFNVAPKPPIRPVLSTDKR